MYPTKQLKTKPDKQDTRANLQRAEAFFRELQHLPNLDQCHVRQGSTVLLNKGKLADMHRLLQQLTNTAVIDRRNRIQAESHSQKIMPEDTAQAETTLNDMLDEDD